MRTFEKLAKRIKEDMGIELVDFYRTYAGINMKSSGAFVWAAKIKGSNKEVSSTVTATELLKRKEPLELMETCSLGQLLEIS